VAYTLFDDFTRGVRWVRSKIFGEPPCASETGADAIRPEQLDAQAAHITGGA